MKTVSIFAAGFFAAGLFAAAPLPAQNAPQVTFVPAQKIAAAARSDSAKLRAGLWYKIFNQGSGYSTGVVRRTQATLAEMHTGWTDVWYVIRGSGTLVTGGSLIAAQKESPGEFRGRGISGGTERRIAPGDVLTVPAGIPHEVRKIDGQEIVYLMVKIAAPAPAAQDPPAGAKGHSIY